MSSIASLGQTDAYLKNTFFATLASSSETEIMGPEFSIIYPTAAEVRHSLNGYDSGGSIHMKIHTATQAKQVEYLKPYLCHWDTESTLPSVSAEPRKAGRGRAAPHIKTYIRFSNSSMENIDWAMLSSANLSKQAWGEGTNKSGDVRICSYEIGVVVWPGLWNGATDQSNKSSHTDIPSSDVEMIPIFMKDTPSLDGSRALERKESESARCAGKAIVGLRMPYDLPVVPYAPSDMPWSPHGTHSIPDWMGRTVQYDS